MLSSMLQAVDDFIASQPCLNRFFVEKLKFTDTDLCKFANVAMRMRQYCESLSNVIDAIHSHAGAAWSVYDVAYAFHNWRRQLAYHHGRYLKHAEQRSGPAGAPERAFSDMEQLQQKLLRDHRFSPGVNASTTDMRLWVKNRVATTASLSGRIREAVQDLLERGVVEAADGAARRGHPVICTRKRPWSEIQADPVATELLQHLRVGAAAFEV